MGRRSVNLRVVSVVFLASTLHATYGPRMFPPFLDITFMITRNNIPQLFSPKPLTSSIDMQADFLEIAPKVSSKGDAVYYVRTFVKNICRFEGAF
jgi:hypothetical protein